METNNDIFRNIINQTRNYRLYQIFNALGNDFIGNHVTIKSVDTFSCEDIKVLNKFLSLPFRRAVNTLLFRNICNEIVENSQYGKTKIGNKYYVSITVRILLFNVTITTGILHTRIIKSYKDINSSYLESYPYYHIIIIKVAKINLEKYKACLDYVFNCLKKIKFTEPDIRLVLPFTKDVSMEYMTNRLSVIDKHADMISTIMLSAEENETYAKLVNSNIKDTISTRLYEMLEGEDKIISVINPRKKINITAMVNMNGIMMPKIETSQTE